MIIEFNQVSKKYGIINALNDVSFRIDPGEFVFIVGPSGAGKSTLIKLILNQIKPSSGSISLDDKKLSDLRKKEVEQVRRKIGVIFQDYQLIPDKNVEENIALGLDIVNYPSADIPRRIDEVLKLVNLETRKFLFPSQLSGGELQRAALARAIAINPNIILADEPTGNLDPENSWNLINLLQEINEKQKTTILMTTHNYEIIRSLNKRILAFENGSLVKDSHKPEINSPEVTTKQAVVKKVKKKKKKKI